MSINEGEHYKQYILSNFFPGSNHDRLKKLGKYGQNNFESLTGQL